VHRSVAVALLSLSGLLMSVVSHASRVTLAWDECRPAGGVSLETFACDTDAGQHALIGTFSLDQPQDRFIGIEVIVDAVFGGESIPPWWQVYEAGSCRRSSLAATFDFSILDGGCADPFQQAAVGGLAHYCRSTSPCVDAPMHAFQARLKIAAAIVHPTAIEADVDYYAFRLVFDHAHTTDGQCPGCGAPACFRVTSIKAAEDDGHTELVPGMGYPEEEFAFWQSAIDCYVAARMPTWGQIKSLYR
jgi:hypothetical protein